MSNIIMVLCIILVAFTIGLSLRYIQYRERKREEQIFNEELEKSDLMSKKAPYEKYTRINNQIRDGYCDSAYNEQ